MRRRTHRQQQTSRRRTKSLPWTKATGEERENLLLGSPLSLRPRYLLPPIAPISLPLLPSPQTISVNLGIGGERREGGSKAVQDKGGATESAARLTSFVGQYTFLVCGTQKGLSVE